MPALAPLLPDRRSHRGWRLPCFLAFAMTAMTALPALGQPERPALFLVSPQRLSEIRVLVQTPGTPHREAYQQMKQRVEAGDPFVLDASYTNYKRAFFARECAWIYLLDGQAADAQRAYQMLWDIYFATNPADDKTPESGSGLNRAQIASSFAMAYNWAHDGWTPAQRAWVLERLRAGLDSWPGHANIGSPYMSNWNGVVEGGRIVALLAAGLHKEYAGDYQKARSLLLSHVGAFGDFGWNQEGPHYLCLSMENTLAAFLGMAQQKDYAGVEAMVKRPLHRLVMATAAFNARQTTLNWGVGTGFYDESGTTSLLLGLVPPADLPYYKWFYDRYRGPLSVAPMADRYDPKHGGSVYFMIFYPDRVAAQPPGGVFPLLLRDNLGGYAARDRWGDAGDFTLGFWTKTKSFKNAWNQVDALSLALGTQGASWGLGPATETVADFMSTLLWEGAAPLPEKTGTLVRHETGSGGARLVARLANPFAGSTVASVERHVLVDFTAPRRLLSVVDRIDATALGRFSWNLHTPGKVNSHGLEHGLPWVLSRDLASGAWLKLWCLRAGALAEVAPAYVRFHIDAAATDLWVVAESGLEPDVPSLLPAPAETNPWSVTLAGRTLGWDAAAGLQTSSAVQDWGVPHPGVSIQATPAEGLAPMALTLSVSDPDPELAFFWDLGDGQTASGRTVAHTYTRDGLYAVTVVGSKAGVPVTRAYRTIRVGNRPPHLVLASLPANVLPGTPVTLNAAGSTDPDGDPLTVHWYFGDGLTATGATVHHTWADEGTYRIRVYVEDSAGLVDGATLSINVSDRPPEASFVYDPLGGLAPLTVQFDASASWDPEGQPLTYHWNFGDGTPEVSSGGNPRTTHTYVNGGEYRVSLRVTDAGMNSDSSAAKVNLRVFAPADVLPAVSPVEGTFGAGMNYAVYPIRSDGGVPDFSLLMPVAQGRTQTFDLNASPLTSYYAIRFLGYLYAPSTGVYQFRIHTQDSFQLRVGGRLLLSGRNDPFEQTVYLEAGYQPLEVAIGYASAGEFGDKRPFLDVAWIPPGRTRYEAIPPGVLFSDFRVFYPTFEYSPPAGHSGQEILFEATMPSPNGQPLTYHWEFGDGQTGSGRKVRHTYTLPSGFLQKVYPVRLTITDSEGLARTGGDTVIISDYAFTSGRPFEESGSNAPSDFLAGKMGQTDQRWDRRSDISRPFAEAVNKARERGTRVTASGTLSDGFLAANVHDGRQQTRWIFGEGVPNAEAAKAWLQFTFQKDGVLQPYRLGGYSMSTNYMTWTWPRDPREWDIYGSNLPSPRPWSFAAAADNSDWQLIQEVRDPRMDYQYNKDNKLLGETGLRYNLSPAEAYAHYLFVLRAQGPNVGYYAVCVSEMELYDWMDQPLPGNLPPIARLTANTTSAEAPARLRFDAGASSDPDGDALYFAWDFGDGHVLRRAEDQTQVEHTFRTPGEYQVKVTVTDGHGATQTAAQTVTIRPETPNQPPVPHWSASPLALVAGGTVHFDAAESFDPNGDAFSWHWEFGDGGNASGPQAFHRFNHPGRYNVLLRLEDARGASSLSNREINVLPANDGRPVVSLSFGPASAYMNPGKGAGVVSVGHWNTSMEKKTVLVDCFGEPTPITYDPKAINNTNEAFPSAFSKLDGNALMMTTCGGGVVRRGWNLALGRVPYFLYDVYVYYSGMTARSEQPVSVTVGGATKWLWNPTPNWAGEFVESTATTGAAAIQGANYVKFERVSGADLIVAFGVTNNSNDYRVWPTGLQIVDRSGPMAPVIVEAPQDQGTLSGTPVTFALAAYGNPAPTFQWYREGQPLPGQDRPELTLTPSLSDDGATFTCRVANALGSVESAPVGLTVVDAGLAAAPAFTAVPVSQSVEVGDVVSFVVAVEGQPPPRLQWLRGGQPLAGANEPTLSFVASLADHQQSFACVATNLLGSATSAPATLEVRERDYAPVVTQHPVAQVVRQGRNVTFAVAGHGRPAPTFQWRRQGVALPGKTAATLTWLAAQEDDGAVFDCVLRNSVGEAVSEPARLSVTPPTIDVNGTLSVNFEHGSTSWDQLAREQSTGVAPTALWNNLNVSQRDVVHGGLLTHRDGDSPVTVHWTTNQVRRDKTPAGTGNPADQLLHAGIGGVAGATLNLGNLAAAYPHGFDLIVYTKDDASARRSFTINAPGTWPTFHTIGGAGAFDGEWTRAAATSSGEAVPAEYVLFEGVPPVNALAIQCQPVSGGRSNIAGFQIVGRRPAQPPRIPYFRVATEPALRTLDFATEAGATYRLQRASHPAGPWEDTDRMVTGDGHQRSLELPALVLSREFYRLVITWQ